MRSLAQSPSIEVVGDFAYGPRAMEEIPPLQPNVALLDLSPGEHRIAVELGLHLRERLRDLGIVLLSSEHKTALLKSVPEHAIAGWSFLCRREVSNLESLRRAIEGTAGGLVVFGPESSGRPQPSDSPLEHLTDRQRQILALMSQGFSNEYIAARLGLSHKTVENYINVIYQKLEAGWNHSVIQPRVKAVLTFLEAARPHQ